VDEDIVVSPQKPTTEKSVDVDKPKKLLKKTNVLSYKREEII
jgi:hypothetical protein